MLLLLCLIIAIPLAWAWNREKRERLSDDISLTTVIRSACDSGPLQFHPDAYNHVDQGNGDPNSNPHYIWFTQGEFRS